MWDRADADRRHVAELGRMKVEANLIRLVLDLG